MGQCLTSSGKVLTPTPSDEDPGGHVVGRMGTGPGAGLKWDQQAVLAQGSNKSVFEGSFEGRAVVVCHARAANKVDVGRAKNEIEVLKELGEHPNIIHMLTHGERDEKPYLVLERVEPIGFDLARLWSQYELVGGKVPSLLCGRLCRQMAEGLQHMHAQGILHLDLKTQNVLVTLDYNSKLCDFGVARKIGTKCQLVAGYMSPELCEGRAPLGAAADCWGVGLILHQMYQRGEWNLVECQRRLDGEVAAKLRAGVPSRRNMPQEVRKAMHELLREDPARRLSLEGLLSSAWLTKQAEPEGGQIQEAGWLAIPKASKEPSKWLVPYQGSSRPLTLLVLVGWKQTHLFDKTLGDLGLGKEFPDPECPVTTLLVRQPGSKGMMILQPGESTKVAAGTRMYLGIPAESAHGADALDRVEQALATGSSAIGASRATSGSTLKEASPSNSAALGSKSPRPSSASVEEEQPGSQKELIMSHHLHEGEARDKKEVDEKGAMYSFAMDFDCFVFPKHIGDEATIGKLPIAGPGGQFAAVKHIALDLRQNFGISLAGIQRVGETEVEWFPDEFAQVRPGDLGLVARCPWEDGSTDSSIKPDDLAKLLVEGKFKAIINTASEQQPAEMGVALNLNPDFSSVLLYNKPAAKASEKLGELPNHTKVKVVDRYGEFLLVESDSGNGWVGTKNVSPE